MILTSRYLGVLNTIANCEGNKDKHVCHRAWLLTTWLLHLRYFEGVGLGVGRQKFRTKDCCNNKLTFQFHFWGWLLKPFGKGRTAMLSATTSHMSVLHCLSPPPLASLLWLSQCVHRSSQSCLYSLPKFTGLHVRAMGLSPNFLALYS